MADLNNCTFTGRLCRDALFKKAGNYDILEFDIAVNGFKPEDTQFFKVTLFGKQAVAIQSYMIKGKQIAVEGSIKTSKWTDRTGTEQKSIGINARSVTLLGESPSVRVTEEKPEVKTIEDAEMVMF
jgi:single-strand DNA-binding protein